MTSSLKTKQDLNLVCPICHQALLYTNNSAECAACRRQWPIVEGVPSFTDSDDYWAEPGITREIARQIIREMRHRNWKDVLADHPSPKVRQQYPFISDLSRAKWSHLLDLPQESVVLDVGAGMGTISQALSTQFAHVYAVEKVKERVEFMKFRFWQEGCDNITLIKTDIDCLPFPENFFDLIVLNGVLEWLPFSRKEENPRRAQLFYLKMLGRFLKPNGRLYIGIENRTNYALFLGGLDPHISIKFVAVLPRFLSHLICKIKTGDIYRPYLYSHYGYRRLLVDAGYRDIEIFGAYSSYNEPRKIISMKNKSIDFVDDVWLSRNRLSNWVKKVMVRLDLLKYFGYSYIIFAKNKALTLK